MHTSSASKGKVKGILEVYSIARKFCVLLLALDSDHCMGIQGGSDVEAKTFIVNEAPNMDHKLE